MYPLTGGCAAFEMPAGEFAVPQPGPEIRVLPIELVEAEHAVVLALERLEAVAEETQEVFVGIEYLAVRGELDDGHGLAYGVVDRVEQEQFGMVAGHVGGDLQHLDDRPFGILHREIGGLQPDRRTVASQALEHAALGRAAGQFLPEAHVGGRGLVVLVAEDPVVLADQFVRRIADRREEQRVGGQYLAIGSESDGGDVLPDGLESPRYIFILGGAFDRPAFSAEEHRARLLDGTCPSRGSREPEIVVLPLYASVDRARQLSSALAAPSVPCRAWPRVRAISHASAGPRYDRYALPIAVAKAGIGQRHPA